VSTAAPSHSDPCCWEQGSGDCGAPGDCAARCGPLVVGADWKVGKNTPRAKRDGAGRSRAGERVRRARGARGALALRPEADPLRHRDGDKVGALARQHIVRRAAQAALALPAQRRAPRPLLQHPGAAGSPARPARPAAERAGRPANPPQAARDLAWPPMCRRRCGRAPSACRRPAAAGSHGPAAQAGPRRLQQSYRGEGRGAAWQVRG